MKKIIICLVLIAAILVFSTKIYSVLSRGVVLDKSTGLYWTRCPMSTDDKPIYDFNCKGTKKLYTWAEAITVCKNLVHEGRSDWRLPTIRELQSIVYFHHNPTSTNNYNQVIELAFHCAVTTADLGNDYSAFWDSYCVSNLCYEHYWSSTLLTGFTNLIWAVNFYTGVVQWDSFYLKNWAGNDITDKPKKKAVRCVAVP